VESDFPNGQLVGALNAICLIQKKTSSCPVYKNATSTPTLLCNDRKQCLDEGLNRNFLMF